MSNNINDKKLKAYYKQIKKALPMYSKFEKNYLKELQTSVDQFVRDHPDATFVDFLNHFGTPDQIAQKCISSLEPPDLYRRIARRMKIKRIVTLIMVLSIGAFCLYTGYLYHLYSQTTGGYAIQETTVYE